MGADRYFRACRSRPAKPLPAHPGLAQGAIATGVGLDQIVTFLERGSRQSLPREFAATLATWARGYRQIRMRRAVILRPDDATERPVLLQALREAGWSAEPLGDLAVLVSLATGATDVDHGEEARIGESRGRSRTAMGDGVRRHLGISGASAALVDQNAVPEGD